MSNMSPDVEGVISINSSVGAIYCLLHILKALGINTSFVTIDHMDSLAYVHYVKKVAPRGSRL